MSWDGYATTWASLHGGYDPRRAPVAVRTWLWLAYRLGRLLARIHVTPTTVTVTALVLSLAVPGAAWLGGPWAAALLVALAAVADSLDGAVAVLTARTSRLGYLYDSLVDRVAELCWLTAFWVLGAPVWLLVVCGGLALLHEYVRAKAVAVGLTEAGSMSVGERSARLVVTVSGLVLAGLTTQFTGGMVAGTVTVAAVVWLFLGLFGLAQLLGGIRKSFG
jgi:phosphatidylglycerophosphate synthase